MRFFLALIILSLTFNSIAQQQNVELNHQFTRWIDKSLNQTHTHTSFKPMLQSEVNYDSLKTDHYSFISPKNRWLGRKLLNDNLIKVDTTNFQFTIDPLLFVETGNELETGKLYKNTRGLLIRSNIGKTISFSTAYYESQAYFPSYVSDYVLSLGETGYPGFGVVPGQGRAKPFKNGGFDYGMASAYVNFAPNKRFNIRTGHGKHFIGEGYRSILLSDNAFNYPYLRMGYTFGKNNQFQYSNLIASLFENKRVPKTKMPEAPYIKKALSVHYLNYSPTNWLQIGLFESTVWKTWDDSLLISKSFNPQIYNPVIGINYFTTLNSSENFSCIGTNLKIMPHKYLTIYNQFSYSKALGSQLGFKLFDLFGLLSNFYIQGEFNFSQLDYNTYNYYTKFTQYEQPLNHFYGNGFKEIVGIVNYQYKRLLASVKINQILLERPIQLQSSNSSYKYNISVINGEIGYLVNPSYNLNIYLGYNARTSNINNSNINSTYIYFGLRTSLRNLYYDF